MDQVTQYLVHSYLDYIMYEAVIPDYEYDALCRDMLNNFDLLESPYMHLIEEDALRAGTGYQIPASKYPEDIIAIAKKLIGEIS